MKRPIILALVAIAISTASAQQAPTFRSGVKLVEVNVVVRDRSGQPVADLTASDFKIFEDGKEQKVELFNVEDSRPAAARAPSPLPAGVFSNRATGQAAGSVTAILLDRLNSSLDDQKIARDQILKYLAKLQPTDKIALYVLESDAITVLHDFSSDTALLIASLNRHLGTSSLLLDRSQEPKPLVALTGVALLDADTEAWLQRTTEAVQAAYLRRRGMLTTDALEAIANHLAGIPGRKNLVWVSGAFPLIFPDELGKPQNVSSMVSRATRAINAANVAVYPVDIRGLMGAFVNPTNATATVQRPTFGVATPQAPVFNTLETVSTNQDAMRSIADDTGGRVFVNSNAIAEGVRRAMDDARLSYVVGYYSPRTDDRFHQLEVKVSRGGLDVRHRKGYLALSPPKAMDAKARLVSLERVMLSPIAASAIELAAGFERQGAEGALTFRMNPEAITWNDNKGVREGAIDVVIAQSTPEGKYFKVKETTVNLTADPRQYQQMLDEGFTLSSNVKLEPTAYRLHVIVSDVASQAVGSLIIPIKGG